MEDLTENLIEEGWLKTPRIIEAFRKIKRADFLPESLKGDKKKLSQLNEALPIGYSQTISQPLVVAFMLELLAPQVGEKILDIGSGSGWTTGLLSQIVGEKGKVIAIEIVPELKEFGENNVAKYNFIKKGIAEFLCVDGSKGYTNISSRPEFAEGFDKILASAAAKELSQAWKDQLKVDGKIVTPIGSSIWLFVKKSQTEFKSVEYPGFAFVPLISK